jgi:hypothetical protein
MSNDRTQTGEWDGAPNKATADRNSIQPHVAGFNDAGETKPAEISHSPYVPGKWSWGSALSSIDRF